MKGGQFENRGQFIVTGVFDHIERVTADVEAVAVRAVECIGERYLRQVGGHYWIERMEWHSRKGQQID